jgi:hypothetical protein
MHEDFLDCDDHESSFFLTNHIMHAPNLKRLSLWNCSVEEVFGSFHNISHLSISEGDFHIITANLLRRVLLEMPNLETLGLHSEVRPTLTPAVDLGIRVATLPKLYHINISADWHIERTISILQTISYGPRRKLQVSGLCNSDRVEPVLQLSLASCRMQVPVWVDPD